MRPRLELDSRWWTLGGAEVLDVMSSVRSLVRKGQVVHIGTDAPGLKQHQRIVQSAQGEK